MAIAMDGDGGAAHSLQNPWEATPLAEESLHYRPAGPDPGQDVFRRHATSVNIPPGRELGKSLPTPMVLVCATEAPSKIRTARTRPDQPDFASLLADSGGPAAAETNGGTHGRGRYTVAPAARPRSPADTRADMNDGR
jgi:hypothetical protein